MINSVELFQSLQPAPRYLNGLNVYSFFCGVRIRYELEDLLKDQPVDPNKIIDYINRYILLDLSDGNYKTFDIHHDRTKLSIKSSKTLIDVFRTIVFKKSFVLKIKKRKLTFLQELVSMDEGEDGDGSSQTTETTKETNKKKKRNPKINIFNFWRDHQACLIVDKCDFLPQHPHGVLELRNEDDIVISKIFNEWTGFIHESSFQTFINSHRQKLVLTDDNYLKLGHDSSCFKFKYYANSCSNSMMHELLLNPYLLQILTHLYEVLCRHNRKLMLWILGWFACIAQRPWIKTETVPIFIGPQGCGKSRFLDNILKYIFGCDHTLYTSQKVLVNPFTEMIKNRVLLVIDEVALERKDADELKAIITGTTRKDEAKFCSAKSVANYLNFIFTSNNSNPIPLESGNNNRRYVEITCNPNLVGNLEYFDKLEYAFMNDSKESGAKAFFYLLKLLDLSSFNVSSIPLTEEIVVNARLCNSMIENWWESCLNDRCNVDPRDVGIGAISDPDCSSWLMNCPIESMMNMYIRYVANFTNSKVTRSEFITSIAAILPEYKIIENLDPPMINIPSHNECRIYFNKIKGKNKIPIPKSIRSHQWTPSQNHLEIYNLFKYD